MNDLREHSDLSNKHISTSTDSSSSDDQSHLQDLTDKTLPNLSFNNNSTSTKRFTNEHTHSKSDIVTANRNNSSKIAKNKPTYRGFIK